MRANVVHTAYLSDVTEACYGHTWVSSLSLGHLLDFPLCLLLYWRMIGCLPVTHEFLQIEKITYFYLGKYSSSVKNKPERLQYSFVTSRITKSRKYNTLYKGKLITVSKDFLIQQEHFCLENKITGFKSSKNYSYKCFLN